MQKQVTLVAGLLFSAWICVARAQVTNPAMPIIILAPGEGCSTQRVVGLQLDYGLIVSNGDTNSVPSYYLFSRNEKRIVKTHDVRAFLAELDSLPDGATIDLVSKCTVPFYTQHGTSITDQYSAIMALLQKKRARLVSSLEDDRRHASFCYCGSRITILERYEAESAPRGLTQQVIITEAK